MRSAKIPFDEKLIQHLVERKSQLEIELANQVKLFIGARELLEALNGKIKLGLASMNNRTVIMHMLKTNKIEKFFHVILTAESIAHSKPNPEIFLKTASQLKVTSEKCVVIEDSIFGVEAAKSAKMSCIAVLTGVYSKLELEREKPDLVVKALSERQILHFILK